MTLRPIRTEADYESALERAAALMDAAPGTPESDDLDVLATLIERYEDEHMPIPPPDPIEAVLFRLEQSGRSTQDLRDILGVSRGRLSELLNRKRRLSLEMIRTLVAELEIPAEILVQTDGPAPSVSRRGTPRRGRGQRRPRLSPERSTTPNATGSGASSLPELVSAHLRADRNLDPAAADMLGKMFRAAYEQAAGAEPEEEEDAPDGNSVA
jgi:HTH-type transcriptional regulator / antitoxin HigA